MSKILAIETCMSGVGHIHFNTVFLEIVQSVFSAKEMHFYAEERHAKYIIEKYDKPIQIHKIRLLPYHIYLLPLFDFISSFNLLFVLFKSKRDDIIVITNKLPMAHILFNFFNLFFKRNCFMPLHGEMEAFVNPNGIGLTRYYFFLHKLAFLLSGKWTRYVILGESIKKNIQKKIKIKNRNIICINHPYDYKNTENGNSNIEIPIKIAFIGRAVKQKNAQLIFKLAEKLKKEIESGLLEFEIIGILEKEIMPYINKLVMFSIDDGKMFDEYIFQKKIKSSHFAISFLDNSLYKAIPSGVFFDILKYEKPLIALRGNDFIDYYFLKFGNMGYLCNDIDEMSDVIRFLIKNIHKNEYKTLIENIRTARGKMSIPHIQESFRQQIIR
jgi:glycosyltransferase involved in cell wall biosynthesis